MLLYNFSIGFFVFITGFTFHSQQNSHDSLETHYFHEDQVYPNTPFNKLYSKINDKLPPSKTVHDEGIKIAEFLVSYPGKVDSVKLLDSFGDATIDSIITNVLYEVTFHYPDTTFGYPTHKWIRFPINSKRISNKSFLEKLKFW